MGDKGLKAIDCPWHQGRQYCPPRVLRPLQRRVEVTSRTAKKNRFGSHADSAGLGSPQEMLHVDEKWHTETFLGARTREKSFWTKEVEEWKKTTKVPAPG